MPLLLGCAAAAVLLTTPHGSMGPRAQTWQFVAGIGMACAVTALPMLILLMEKLAILRQPVGQRIGQRILRYASLDDIAIRGVLAAILLDWGRVGRQVFFLAAFALLTVLLRRLRLRLPERDRWWMALIMIIFVKVLLDQQIITALLLMAVASTMLTVPRVTPMLERMKSVLVRSS